MMDSISSSGSDEKERVLVHALYREEGKKYDVGELYTVDLGTGQVDQYSGPDPLLKVNSLTRMLVLGSNVYIIGGYYPPPPDPPLPPKDDEEKYFKLPEEEVVVEEAEAEEEGRVSHFRVSCFNHHDRCWEALPPFESPDIQSNCIAYGGKIYLFRGLGYYNDPRFHGVVGEVFDPCLKTWEYLIPPGPYPLFGGGLLRRISYPAVLDEKNKRIIVHFADMNVLYAYYPDRDYNWEPLVFLKNFCMWDSRVIILDDVLYFYVPGKYNPFVAFDLRNKRWPEVTTLPPTHFQTQLLKAHFDSFYHVRDNTVCLATWSTDDDPCKTRLVFVKFSIERTSLRQITVTPLRSQTLYIDKSCYVKSFLPL